MSKHISEGEPVHRNRKYITWSYIVLLAGIAIIMYRGYILEEKYGYWDAWWIWDYHAKFLKSSEYWRQLFSLDTAFHPDYPLYISATVAFFWRIIGKDTMVVPYAFSFLISLLIPVVIYLDLYRKNLPVAAIVLLVFAFDKFYLRNALSQYADLPLGFLFLCCFTCIDKGKEREQASMVAVIAALLGCCMWMKNEGALLALVFIAFNTGRLFAQGSWRYFLAGIIFPVSVLLFFKIGSKGNELINGQSVHTLAYLFDFSRYKLIAQSMYEHLSYNFIPLDFGLLFYIIFCMIEKKLPGRNMQILLCCTLGFFLVYILSPLNLEWHLSTSLDRVLLQLMPSFVYVIALRLSDVQFVLPNKQLQ